MESVKNSFGSGHATLIFFFPEDSKTADFFSTAVVVFLALLIFNLYSLMALYVEREINDLICLHIIFLPNSETSQINDFCPVIFNFLECRSCIVRILQRVSLLPGLKFPVPLNEDEIVCRK